jgi:hypothetical protein
VETGAIQTASTTTQYPLSRLMPLLGSLALNPRYASAPASSGADRPGCFMTERS